MLFTQLRVGEKSIHNTHSTHTNIDAWKLYEVPIQDFNCDCRERPRARVIRKQETHTYTNTHEYGAISSTIRRKAYENGCVCVCSCVWVRAASGEKGERTLGEHRAPFECTTMHTHAQELRLYECDYAFTFAGTLEHIRLYVCGCSSVDFVPIVFDTYQT